MSGFGQRSLLRWKAPANPANRR